MNCLNPHLVVYSIIFFPMDLVGKYVNNGKLNKIGFLHVLFQLSALVSLCLTLGGSDPTVFWLTILWVYSRLVIQFSVSSVDRQQTHEPFKKYNHASPYDHHTAVSWADDTLYFWLSTFSAVFSQLTRLMPIPFFNN